MIGVIADDLTGAAELGAVGWRLGLRAEIVGLNRFPRDAGLVCINTDSRSLSAHDAARRAADAAETLQRADVRWIYKKVDSVLRGHIVSETQAIVTRLGLQSALLVPANPGRGRVVSRGQYLVGGKPIHETEFGRDPEHPRWSSKVAELLGDPGDKQLQVRGTPGERPSSGIIVGEAGSTEDLRSWAGARSPSVLMGGAAEFFEVLLEADLAARGAGRPDRSPEDSTGPGLFVCGTRSESAGRFLAVARRLGVPVIAWHEGDTPPSEANERRAAQVGRRVVESLHSASSVILTSHFASAPAPAEAGLLSSQLSRLAADVVRQTAISHLYVEGGATASHLFRELGWEQLRVVGALAPGVVTLEPHGLGSPRVTLKPGSYDWPDAIQRRLACGRESPPSARLAVGGREASGK